MGVMRALGRWRLAAALRPRVDGGAELPHETRENVREALPLLDGWGMERLRGGCPEHSYVEIKKD